MKNKKKRRLAAIMFTDIVGYTALMQQNEAKAAATRNRHRIVFDQCHQQTHGEIIQYFGDGTLSIFQSGVEAVECAIAIQEELQKGEKIPLRIGLHVGDIVFDGTDIYGDSVNVASRIESMGVAGAVLLSGQLNKEVKNHPQIKTLSLGEFQLKNIHQPIEVFAVSNKYIKVPARADLKGKQEKVTKSIAVLPFINRSVDPDNEYFSDGMTEEIINALAKIKGLRVTSRTSSFHFKNKTIPMAEIGKALKVSTILEGSVRLAKNKLRITARLIDVDGDFYFWSQTFDRPLDDIFAVQDEISLLIADKLREHLGHFEIENQLVFAPDISLDIYKNYLKSRYYILKMTKLDIEKGIAILEKIITRKPDFALAYLGVHLGYTMLGTIGLMPASEAFLKGETYLDKAIELSPALPECQLNLSYMAFLQQWNLEETYIHLNKSFEQRPTVEYYQSMASILVAEGKFVAANNYINIALQIDPFSAINFHLKGFVAYVQRQYEVALSSFDKAIELNTGFMASILYKGQAIILAGRAMEGLTYFQHLPEDGQNDVLRGGGLTLAHAALGNVKAAERGIKKLEAALQTDLVDRATNFLILCHAMLNNEDKVLQLIEQAINYRLPMLVYLNVEPILRRFHSNGHFQEMMKQVIKTTTNEKNTKRKYKKNLLSEIELREYKDQLEQLMQREKPYLLPDLTLRSLASCLNLPANYMSQLLNEGFHKNFSEYVNSYRLADFKNKIIDPKNQHLTILALAYDSGFNSKTVFNTFFKKTMGLTPKAYVKEVLNK